MSSRNTDAENTIGYHFKNTDLLNEALLAAGAPVSQKDISGPADGNKRLAFLGDAVLRLIIVDEWFPSGKSTEEGHTLVKRVGCNDRLRDVATNDGLQKDLIENPCEKGKSSRTTLASTVEAIIGAVWMDSGKNLAVVRQVISNLGLLQV